MTSLFEPLTIGAVELPHRVLMAPLTRMRATAPYDVPNDLMVEYYRQRAGAGLIVSEGTQISPLGKGYMDTPGIYSDEQVEGWRRVTDAVHAEGGRIAAQLWHVGRVSHESFHDGELPVSASALPYRNRATIKGPDGNPLRANCPTPRALSAEEIAATVEDYRRASTNAREAGFDLAEIHGAHGYLVHQFLSPVSNHRDDAYGGTEENRFRFPLEVVDAVVDGWSADRVGIRISPQGSFNGLDVDELDAGARFAAELGRRDLAFLHLSEPDWAGGAGDRRRVPRRAALGVRGRHHRRRQLHRGQGRAVDRGRPHRRGCLRARVHRQPRPARAAASRRRPERAGAGHLLRRRRRGLHRLRRAGCMILR